MAEKRVSVRLAVVGGREVRAELEGVGEAGNRGFGRLGREMEAANARLAAFSARVKIATAAAIAAAAASGIAMVRSGLATVDAQAKLAESLDTTVASIQVLERAGELAGVAMSGIEQATKGLTRRLSQAASGAGPAAEALGRLGLSAGELLALPLDERVGRINQAIAEFIPAAERAAVAGQEGSIAMSRIDTATLRQATQDVRDFGVVVSEADADRIERANAAISRLGLIWRGLSNQLAVAAEDQASVRGVGCDCLGLVRGVWRDLYGPEPMPIPPYSRDWGETGSREPLAEAARRVMPELPTTNLAAGALVLFRMRNGAIAKHCGIVSTPDRFIHAYERSGVVEAPLDAAWRRRIAFAFLFPDPS